MKEKAKKFWEENESKIKSGAKMIVVCTVAAGIGVCIGAKCKEDCWRAAIYRCCSAKPELEPILNEAARLALEKGKSNG